MKKRTVSEKKLEVTTSKYLRQLADAFSLTGYMFILA
jgi:hypothetical protein